MPYPPLLGLPGGPRHNKSRRRRFRWRYLLIAALIGVALRSLVSGRTRRETLVDDEEAPDFVGNPTFHPGQVWLDTDKRPIQVGPLRDSWACMFVRGLGLGAVLG